MSTAEPTNEAHNLSSMADDVLRAILARAVFDDQAALKRVCKRFLAVITSRAFREERRASGCLEHTVLALKYTEGQHWDWKHICWLLRQPAKDSKTGNRAWRPENSDEAENPRGVLSRSIPSSLSSVAEPQTVLFGDATLFIGGWLYERSEVYEHTGMPDNETPSAEVYAFDTAMRGASPWRQHSRLRQARAGQPAVGVIGGRLYVAGGMVFHDDQEALLAAAPDEGDRELWDTIFESQYREAIDSVECYDPATGTWEPRAPMPMGVGYAAYCVIGGRLYVAGGTRGPGTGKGKTREVLDEIQAGGMGIQGCLQAYDPSTDTWEVLAGLDTVDGPRKCAAAAVVDGGFLVIGGGDTSQRGNANSMVRYNIASDTWDAPEPLPRMGGMYSSGDRYWTNTEPARSIIGSAEGPARSLHVGNCRIPWWTEVSGGSWTTLVAMRTNQYTTPIFAFDGEGAFARKSFAGLPCGGPGGMAWGLATLG